MEKSYTFASAFENERHLKLTPIESVREGSKKEKRQTIDLTGLIWRNYSNINIMVMSDYYE